MFQYITFLVLLGLFTFETNSASFAWTYDDQTQWPGLRCSGGGNRQSPIDINTTHVIKDYNSHFIKYGPLRFSGYQDVLVTGINNGHTILFSTDGDISIHPTVTGGPLKHQYRLEQLHFHWISEHSIDGFKFPMEVHFVHVRSDLTVNKALMKRDGLAIVAVFCTIKDEMEDNSQETSEEIMQHVPRLLNTGDNITDVLLDMTKLMSPNTKSYYTYAGSLTSPECNEAVIWIVFDSPIYMTEDQYLLFNKAGLGRTNYRNLQKLKEHKVYMPAHNMLQLPHIILVVRDVATVFYQFFKNVTSFFRKPLHSR